MAEQKSYITRTITATDVIATSMHIDENDKAKTTNLTAHLPGKLDEEAAKNVLLAANPDTIIRVSSVTHTEKVYRMEVATFVAMGECITPDEPKQEKSTEPVQ